MTITACRGSTAEWSRRRDPVSSGAASAGGGRARRMWSLPWRWSQGSSRSGCPSDQAQRGLPSAITR